MAKNKLRGSIAKHVEETQNLPPTITDENTFVPGEIITTINKKKKGRPRVAEKMVRRSYAIHESTYNEIQRFVESKGDQMANYVRRAIMEKYQSDRRS